MGVLNDRIKVMRIVRGYTLAYVAELLGIKEATMQRYESGEIKNIKHETITKLAEIYTCSPSYLMGWDTPNTKEKPFDYFLEQQLRIMGYEVIYDDEDGYVILKYQGTEYEIVDESLNELSSSTKSYIDFKLHEIMKLSRKIGIKKKVFSSPKEYLEPRAAHERTDIEVTDEMRKHDDDIMNDDDFWNE